MVRIAALALAAMLVACGGSDNSTTGTSTTSTNPIIGSYVLLSVNGVIPPVQLSTTAADGSTVTVTGGSANVRVDSTFDMTVNQTLTNRATGGVTPNVNAFSGTWVLSDTVYAFTSGGNSIGTVHYDAGGQRLNVVMTNGTYSFLHQ